MRVDAVTDEVAPGVIGGDAECHPWYEPVTFGVATDVGTLNSASVAIFDCVCGWDRAPLTAAMR